jgi:hypothetical protein
MEFLSDQGFSDLLDRNVPWSRNPLTKRQCHVLPNWENEPQALRVNADFQWQLTQHFAIDLDRHSPITIDSDPVGGFKMDC